MRNLPHARAMVSPCVVCPIGFKLSGRLHPLAEMAIELHGLLNGGPAGMEAYRLRTFLIEQDRFEIVVASLMREWATLISEVEAEQAEIERIKATDKFPG